jgi:hypothetical protein
LGCLRAGVQGFEAAGELVRVPVQFAGGELGISGPWSSGMGDPGPVVLLGQHIIEAGRAGARAAEWTGVFRRLR